MSKPPQPSSIGSSLLEGVQAMDAGAWQRLVELYAPVIYGWCRQSAVQPHDAADVVQEVFRAVLTGVGQFRRDRPGESFRGWLWTITRNKIRDHARRRQRRPAAAGGSDAAEQLQQLPEPPPPAPTSRESDGLVHRALTLIRAEFEEPTWRAFWQATVDGRPAAEIARELGMSKGAVRQAKYRVLRRLREELAGLG